MEFHISTFAKLSGFGLSTCGYVEFYRVFPYVPDRHNVGPAWIQDPRLQQKRFWDPLQGPRPQILKI